MPAAIINMGCGPPAHAISHVPCQPNAALLLLGTPYTTAQSDHVITRPHTFVILLVFYLYFVVTFTNMNFEFKEEILERDRDNVSIHTNSESSDSENSCEMNLVHGCRL